MTDKIYQNTKLGDSLLNTLQQLCDGGQLDGAQARQIAADFDEVMAAELRNPENYGSDDAKLTGTINRFNFSNVPPRPRDGRWMGQGGPTWFFWLEDALLTTGAEKEPIPLKGYTKVTIRHVWTEDNYTRNKKKREKEEAAKRKRAEMAEKRAANAAQKKQEKEKRKLLRKTIKGVAGAAAKRKRTDSGRTTKSGGFWAARKRGRGGSGGGRGSGEMAPRFPGSSSASNNHNGWNLSDTDSEEDAAEPGEGNDDGANQNDITDDLEENLEDLLEEFDSDGEDDGLSSGEAQKSGGDSGAAMRKANGAKSAGKPTRDKIPHLRKAAPRSECDDSEEDSETSEADLKRSNTDSESPAASADAAKPDSDSDSDSVSEISDAGLAVDVQSMGAENAKADLNDDSEEAESEDELDELAGFLADFETNNTLPPPRQPQLSDDVIGMSGATKPTALAPYSTTRDTQDTGKRKTISSLAPEGSRKKSKRTMAPKALKGRGADDAGSDDDDNGSAGSLQDDLVQDGSGLASYQQDELEEDRDVVDGARQHDSVEGRDSSSGQQRGVSNKEFPQNSEEGMAEARREKKRRGVATRDGNGDGGCLSEGDHGYSKSTKHGSDEDVDKSGGCHQGGAETSATSPSRTCSRGIPPLRELDRGVAVAPSPVGDVTLPSPSREETVEDRARKAKTNTDDEEEAFGEDDLEAVLGGDGDEVLADGDDEDDADGAGQGEAEDGGGLAWRAGGISMENLELTSSSDDGGDNDGDDSDDDDDDDAEHGGDAAPRRNGVFAELSEAAAPLEAKFSLESSVLEGEEAKGQGETEIGHRQEHASLDSDLEQGLDSLVEDEVEVNTQATSVGEADKGITVSGEGVGRDVAEAGTSSDDESDDSDDEAIKDFQSMLEDL